eukprot:CAMPEP_0185038100 /NCGR_PEP_ID=MMETSP1103-20130426/33328_1 /TAXON_ID=36769 /ORGANISM="Paraphysomonas bandaiensis, Strain Caron Lab Isolate" /LENGTH=243 /DNA_ID=CAMNT_0027576373 /DNA_START=184 /DNA_END=915 /DNA_ORIENTATION=-
MVRKFGDLSIQPHGEEPPSKLRKSVDFKKKKQTKVKTKVPIFFVGIRLSGQEIRDCVESIQEYIRNRSPHLKNCFVSSKKIHLTCFVMHLSRQDEIDMAVSSLMECQESIRGILSHIPTPRRLFFNNLDRFKSNVLHAVPVQSDALDALRNITVCIYDKFKENGIIKDSSIEKYIHSWKPHLTIAKVSAGRNWGKKLRILPADYDGFESFEPKAAALTTIDLLKMTEMSDDGYYKSYANIAVD